MKIYNESLADMYPELAAQWHPTKNGNLKPTDITPCSGKKVWWYLPYDDSKTGKHFDFEWEAVIQTRTKGATCPYLIGQKVHPEFNSLAAKRPDLAKEWHPTKNGKLKPTDVTASTNQKVWWKIEVDGKVYEWKASINKRCLGCTHPALSQSYLEKAVSEILEKSRIQFKQECGIKGCISPQNRMLRFDFIIDSQNIVIECDGIQHFEPLSIFKGEKGFDKRVLHDNIKNQYCKDNNLYLLRIPYIYDTVSNRGKIEQLVLDFIQTKQIPDEVIDFYKQFDFSCYCN